MERVLTANFAAYLIELPIRTRSKILYPFLSLALPSPSPLRNAISWASVAQYVKATGKTVAAQYLLDFGYVTRGTTKTKKFRVQNTSHSPMYLSVSRQG